MKIKNVTLIIIMSSVLLLFVYYIEEGKKAVASNQSTVNLIAENIQESHFSPILTTKEANFNITKRKLKNALDAKLMQEKNTTDTVSLDTAKEWTSAWRTANPDTTATRSYFVPAADLVQVLNEIGVINDAAATSADTTNQGVRVYMAIEKIGKTSIDKILIVGTKLDTITGIHRDFINGTLDGKGTRPPNTTSGIYDFTSPCPNTCDDQSPLDN
ncbi:hypothetical protein [Aquimarina litoralis]|uniref:hypothetical protein n=1 Tax=Aquimarina litoralis TaxID=584605 RepID=UPI001C5743A3|nr:hypothetical protein [Aquimarina litoralis]MBW1297183.1 hypothetical protein [Aquimarina litoralis]